MLASSTPRLVPLALAAALLLVTPAPSPPVSSAQLHEHVLHVELTFSPARDADGDVWLPALHDAVAPVSVLDDMAPLFTVPDAGARGRWMRMTVHAFADADDVTTRIRVLPFVAQAFVAPEISLPLASSPTRADDACPITTPSFESYQGYLGPAPHGIDAPAAWRRGLRGAGVWFADIEGGWNGDHEDLPGDRILHIAGTNMRDPAWRAHGTAVLGEVVGKDNSKGVVGIAPDVERVFTASIAGVAVADAIDRAARRLRPGDVLLIELQSGGPRNRYIPVEYWDDIYAAIKAATDRGVIIIEAAGNGAENLDHAAYNRKFDRRVRDSGAILVGAGGPNRAGFSDRERLDFSNYGSIVDVQGWGRKVATLDYGDLQSCTSDGGRHYTGEFSGTSSASPIVAGAAILAQQHARSRGRVLSPAAMRHLLTHTGTPQAGDVSEHIGPRPDLATALRHLDR